MFDYGRSAAVFYDGISGKGFRVSTKPNFQAQAAVLAVKDGLIKKGQKVEEFSQLEREVTMNAFLRMPKDDLLDCRPVTVKAVSLLRQGRKQPRSICARCGEVIMDGKGLRKNAEVVCFPCFYGSYYVSD
jgi:formylmethanofuran dehydrogenase subunit E